MSLRNAQDTQVRSSEAYPLPPDISSPQVVVGEEDVIVEQIAVIRYASGYVALKRSGTSIGRERCLGCEHGSIKNDILVAVENLVYAENATRSLRHPRK